MEQLQADGEEVVTLCTGEFRSSRVAQQRRGPSQGQIRFLRETEFTCYLIQLGCQSRIVSFQCSFQQTLKVTIYWFCCCGFFFFFFTDTKDRFIHKTMGKITKKLLWLSKAIVTRYMKRYLAFLLIQRDRFTLWGCFTLFPEVFFLQYYHVPFSNFWWYGRNGIKLFKMFTLLQMYPFVSLAENQKGRSRLDTIR